MFAYDRLILGTVIRIIRGFVQIMGKRKLNVLAWAHFIISFFLIVASFLATFYYATYFASREQVYTSYRGKDPIGGVANVSFSISKEWEESDGRTGAQYDFIMDNKTGHPLVKWTASLTVPEDIEIDSIWNVDYELDGQTLTLTPYDYLMDQEKGDKQTFGFVAISEHEITIKSVTLKATPQVRATDLSIYYMIIAVAIIWLILFIRFITAEYYRTQQERDHEIIRESMRTFINFLDAKDTYTKGHSTRVGLYTRALAEEMRRQHLIRGDELDLDDAEYCGLMHDCGKMIIPDDILNKPGQQDEEESEKMHEHAVAGAQILENFHSVPGIRDAALYHHERYDGQGYPKGISGKQIPLIARIICVADSYDAMSTDRIYRKTIPQEQIIQELRDCSGRQFDPDVVAVMIDLLRNGTIEKIRTGISDDMI